MNREELKEIENFIKCTEGISEHFTITPSNSPGLDHFTSFESKEKPQVHKAWTISRSNYHFRLILVTYQVSWQTYNNFTTMSTVTASHCYFFGLLDLIHDFGRAIIRPETIIDKISEIFEPMEVDFPGHSKFNWNYFVLANEKDKLMSNFPHDALDFLAEVKEPVIEFYNHQCLFYFPTVINRKDSIALCEIGIRLDEIINLRISKDIDDRQK
jgi:hypothetical protein